MNSTTSLLGSALLASLLGLAACGGSVDSLGEPEPDPGTGGAGGGTTSSATSTSSSATSSSSSTSTSTSSSTSTSTSTSASTSTGVGGAPQGCDLDAQDCPDGESCYPTADAAVCEPTGEGEAWTQCEANADCQEGLFCNPHNFMHCVPYCAVGGDDCPDDQTCYETDQIDMPPGYGYCSF